MNEQETKEQEKYFPDDSLYARPKREREFFPVSQSHEIIAVALAKAKGIEQ